MSNAIEVQGIELTEAHLNAPFYYIPKGCENSPSEWHEVWLRKISATMLIVGYNSNSDEGEDEILITPDRLAWTSAGLEGGIKKLQGHLRKSTVITDFFGNNRAMNTISEHKSSAYTLDPNTMKLAADISDLKYSDPVKKPYDIINSPKHYNFSDVEPIKAIESWNLGFHLGNAIKYIARAKHKGNELEDLKKAQYYLDRYIKCLERDSE
jgi:hypothetical protein